MANVKFLRGFQTNLPLSTGAVEGTFYLTTDTHRLYIGNSAGRCDLVSQAIITVANQQALSGITPAEGSFYYLIAEDVLAVYSNNTWKQVNVDDYPVGLDYEIENDSGVITLTPQVHFGSYNTQTHQWESHNLDFEGDTFTLSGDGSVSVAPAASGKGAVITGVEYGVNQSSTTDNSVITSVTIALTEDGVVNNQKQFQLIKGNGIHFASNDNGKTITISGPNPEEISGVTAVAVSPVESHGNGYEVAITLSTTDVINGTFDPTIKVGVNTAQQTTVHFVDGIADLSGYVYTKDEIDASLTGLNAMVYMGVIASAADVPSTNIRIGDTYIVSTQSASGITIESGKVAHNGDMVIARGTESATTHYITSDLTWDVISASNNDTTYKFVYENTTNNAQVKLVPDNGSGDEAGIINIKGDGTYITASGSSTQLGTTITLHHEDVSRTDTTSTASQNAGDETAVTVVDSVSTDVKGHITGVNVKTITLVDTSLDDAASDLTQEVTVTNGVAAIETSLEVTDSSTASVSKTSTVNVESSTLNMSVAQASGNLVVNLEWGSFDPAP